MKLKNITKHIVTFVTGEAVVMVMYILSIVVTFFISVILARNLGPEVFGKYSYLLALIALAISFVTAGFPSLLIREIPIYKESGKYEFIEGIIKVSVIFVVVISGLVILVMALNYNSDIYNLKELLAAISAILFVSLSLIIDSATRGLGFVVAGQISSKIVIPIIRLLLLSIVIMGFYSELLTIKTALYIFTLSAFIGLLFSIFLFRSKRKKYRHSVTKYEINRWYSSLWRMSFLGWMGALNIQLSIVFLGFLGSTTDVANYKVAAQIASLIPFGLMVMNSIQMPVMSKAFHNGNNIELQRLASRSCIISLVVAIPIVFIALFFGEELISGLFGSEYLSAAAILFVLAFGQLINVSAGSTGVLMLVSQKEHTVMVTQAVVLVLNIVLCILLIPRIGAMGAAYASAISLSVRNIYLIFFIYKNMKIVSLPKM